MPKNSSGRMPMPKGKRSTYGSRKSTQEKAETVSRVRQPVYLRLEMPVPNPMGEEPLDAELTEESSMESGEEAKQRRRRRRRRSESDTSGLPVPDPLP